MTERLRKILKGGKIDPKTADEAAVKYAIDNAGGGGSLPDPGAVGNVLTSTGDGWKSAAPQGDEFVVTADMTPGLDTITFGNASASMAEIQAAYEDGKTVRFCSQYPADNPIMWIDVQLSMCVPIGGGATVYALGVAQASASFGDAALVVKLHENDGQTVVDAILIPMLPTVSASENGKVLCVEDGAYALLAPKYPLIVHGTADYINQTAEITDDISLSDIYTAAASDRYVAFECSLDEGNTTRIQLSSYTLDNGEYSFVFTNAAMQSDKLAVISAEFENNTTGTFSFNVAQ